jgi:hypothetical protein
MKTTYFIDTSTGTWGLGEDIVFLEVEVGAEAAMLVNTLEGMSDSQIIDYGNAHGDCPLSPEGM